MLTEILIHLLSFTGIVAGFVVAHYSWDELKIGEKYFEILKRFILVGIALFLLYISVPSDIATLFFFAGLVFGYVLPYTSGYLGLAGVASILQGHLVMIPSLIFLYGLPDGTLNYYHHKRPHLRKHTLMKFVYFAVPIIFLIYPLSISITPFVAGALLIQLR